MTKGKIVHVTLTPEARAKLTSLISRMNLVQRDLSGTPSKTSYSKARDQLGVVAEEISELLRLMPAIRETTDA